MKQKPTRARLPVLGEPVTFWPAEFVTPAGTRPSLTGHIVYINEPHRYYTVEFQVFGCIMHKSFKFEEGIGYDADLVFNADRTGKKYGRR